MHIFSDILSIFLNNLANNLDLYFFSLSSFMKGKIKAFALLDLLITICLLATFIFFMNSFIKPKIQNKFLHMEYIVYKECSEDFNNGVYLEKNGTLKEKYQHLQSELDKISN